MSDDRMPPGQYDWADHYDRGDTPWDLGRPHPELVGRLTEGTLQPRSADGRVVDPRADLADRPRALVPGCGRGHDALALARAGWAVTALDYVPEVATVLGPHLEALGGQVVLGDALAYRDDEPFDLVWEHTFFCAIDPTERAAYGDLVRATLARGGRHATLVFPLDKPVEEGGPPHGFDAAALEAVLGVGFRRRIEEPVVHAVAKRTRPERFLLLERDGAA